MLSPRVLILAGGLSHEREVSLRSGRRVAEVLREAGCEVTVTDVDDRLLDTLRSGQIDVVWPLLHGVSGEDGAVRDVLELVGVPYVGSDPAACRLSWDKSVAKSIAAEAGLTAPRFVALPHGIFRELGANRVLTSIVERLGLPLVVKPARGGSALGASAVRREESLPRAMVDCFAYGDVALVEQQISGVEVAVTVLDTGDGPVALPPVEIVPDSGFYDFDARYIAGATEFFCPARLSDETAAAVKAAALSAHEAFGLRHVSRTDLIVDKTGQPWFLEVNVAPGMTETSLLPMSIEAAGLSPASVYRQLVERALV
ncbi:D-alanine--D-alanine ligase [Kineosporia sp. NBRC 101731]|uniref:D-alanine--D-alanine ligase family protein n=1 Tax=Kineosporia sp. NBRC 101731 TaxID=3032199 RepID=UPI0024A516F3|nr:D-alanine--D-alanine ligase [Kineosporia sp. NBRC 101731]GLY26881.1 D-alanine--D-alanine ligase [Kineosporia sp. NBRC 101731]